MGKNKEISNQTKKNLIDAFWGIYEKKPLEKISVKEITSKAGYNRGTFYEYFIDVYDLLDQLENSLLPDLEEMPPLSFALDQPVLSMNLHLDLFDKNSKYYMILLGDHGDPSFATKIKNKIKDNLRLIQPVIKEQDKMEYILEFMLSAMIGVMVYWFRNGQNIPRETLMLLLSDFMNIGLKDYVEKTGI